MKDQQSKKQRPKIGLGLPHGFRKNKDADALSEDDEEVYPDSDISSEDEEESTEKSNGIKRISSPPFEHGFVNPALRNAVNARWKRSEEAEILYTLMSTTLAINGVYVGDIGIHTSFATKTGGMTLL